jgi:hypothetical protein
VTFQSPDPFKKNTHIFYPNQYCNTLDAEISTNSKPQKFKAGHLVVNNKSKRKAESFKKNYYNPEKEQEAKLSLLPCPNIPNVQLEQPFSNTNVNKALERVAVDSATPATSQ